VFLDWLPADHGAIKMLAKQRNSHAFHGRQALDMGFQTIFSDQRLAEI